MTLIRSLLSSDQSRRDLSFQSVWGSGGSWGTTSKSHAGVPVDEEKSLQLVTVYSAVSLISEVTGSLPWDVIRVRAGRREELPAPAWMTQPNPQQYDIDFKQRLVTSLLLWGNAYSYVVRDSTGTPIELWPLHPDDVRLEDTSRGRPQWSYRNQPISPDEMLHIPAFGVPGKVLGLSPIGAAKQAVGLGLAAEEFGARFFGQGANPGGVLETDTSLTRDQAVALRDQWMSSHGGTNKSNLPTVLEGGVTWKPISIPNDQAQFLETRKFQRGEIAALFRVPPHLIGDVERSTSWGTGIEQQGIGFVTYTLGPWIARLERAFSSLLPRGQVVKLNVNALLRGDTAARAQFYTSMFQMGSLSPDEIRAKEDLPPIPGGVGETYVQPLNMGPLGINPMDNPDAPNAPDAQEM